MNSPPRLQYQTPKSRLIVSWDAASKPFFTDLFDGRTACENPRSRLQLWLVLLFGRRDVCG